VAAVLTLACSIGTALSPTIASFFAFRILTAFCGTAPIVLGPSVISDIYHPTSRGTAVGWFMSGTLIGPSVGPLIGGVIVTFRSWRVIFWLQTALAAVGGLGILFFLPETSQSMKNDEMKELPPGVGRRVVRLWGYLNPFKVIWLVLRYPNLALAAYASGSIMFNMFGMLTPIRYVLNPRFALTSPAESGLFYLAPGMGYLTGTFFGGRWADRVVRRWIEKRHGNRVPEDRLRSCLLALGVTLPGCMLVYGWTVDREAGGIAVPVIAMFLGGVSQLFCFPSLNTYCLDVMSGRGSEVMAGHLMVRYFFGAGASAMVLPAVKGIGVGWFSTIAAGQMVLGAAALLLVTMYGREWRLKLMAREG
jgi:MFS family permease